MSTTISASTAVTAPASTWAPAPAPRLEPGRRQRIVSIAVLVSVALVLGLVAVVCQEVQNDTEQRLLERHTDQAAAALSVSIGQIRTPLEAVASAAEATGGDRVVFSELMAPLVGEDGMFTAAVLVDLASMEPLAEVGAPASLFDHEPGLVEALLSETATAQMAVLDLLEQDRVLGYGVVGLAEPPRFVVYAEQVPGAGPDVRGPTGDPFSDVDYAIYLGDDEQPASLLAASERQLPIEGRRATATVPFGNTRMLLVMTPTGALGTSLLANLWWIVLLSGAVITVSAAVLLRRLNRTRDHAVELAVDNERIYHQQRHIAETLQLALLPQRLRHPPGSELATRYWPAGTASLIGGDFYDVFEIDDRRWGITIGDVCGHGIAAAALTGLVRHTLRSAAQYSYSPAEMLRSVHVAMIEHDPPTFCTVCLVIFMPDRSGGGELIVALGGHPQPLLRRRDGEIIALGTPGTLLGMVEPQLVVTNAIVRPGDTLLLYTDGLTDLPGDEAVPLSEIESVLASDGDLAVGELADSIQILERRRRPEGSRDDTALLVLRFGHADADRDAPGVAAAPVGQVGLRSRG